LIGSEALVTVTNALQKRRILRAICMVWMIQCRKCYGKPPQCFIQLCMAVWVTQGSQ